MQGFGAYEFYRCKIESSRVVSQTPIHFKTLSLTSESYPSEAFIHSKFLYLTPSGLSYFRD